MLRCGVLERRAVSCRLLDVEFGEKLVSSWSVTLFPLCFVALADRPTRDDADQSDEIRKAKNARFQSPYNQSRSQKTQTENQAEN
jgi:hypothetical protein